MFWGEGFIGVVFLGVFVVVLISFYFCLLFCFLLFFVFLLLFLLAVVVWVFFVFVCLFDCFVLENVNIIKNGNSLDAIEPVDKSNLICHKTVDLSAAASTCSDIHTCVSRLWSYAARRKNPTVDDDVVGRSRKYSTSDSCDFVSRVWSISTRKSFHISLLLTCSWLNVFYMYL